MTGVAEAMKSSRIAGNEDPSEPRPALSRATIIASGDSATESIPPAQPSAESAGEPENPLLTIARSVRWQLTLLCVVAVMFTLYFAQAVFIPITLSVVLTLLLRPLVRWMSRRLHIPESVGGAICLASLLIVMAAGILPLISPAREWLDHLPQHMERASEKLHVIRDQVVQLGKMRTQIAEMAAGGETEEHPTPVTIKEPDLASSAVVLSTTGNMVGTWLVIIVLTYFLLTSGDALLNNILTILPTFSEKRRTVELVKEIERGVSSYLITITIINVGLGIVVALALWLMGVPNPAVWGLMTTVFNYVPFVGQGIAGLIIGFIALLTFDSFGYALLVPAVFYSIAAVEGNLITPAMLGRNMRLNPILVLVFLVWWGWMWGIAGAALAVPILAMLKIGSDRFESTKALATLLGG